MCSKGFLIKCSQAGRAATDMPTIPPLDLKVLEGGEYSRKQLVWNGVSIIWEFPWVSSYSGCRVLNKTSWWKSFWPFTQGFRRTCCLYVSVTAMWWRKSNHSNHRLFNPRNRHYQFHILSCNDFLFLAVSPQSAKGFQISYGNFMKLVGQVFFGTILTMRLWRQMKHR